MVNTTQASTSSSNTKTSNFDEDLRPHSSPSVNSNKKTTPSYERKTRHWSVSSDSLCQRDTISYEDKRCSAGSIENFGENVISFTNASYCSSSNEWEVSKSEIYPLHKTLKDKSHVLERHDEESSQNEETVNARLSEVECRDEKLEETTGVGQNYVSQPKEGLCIFVIGGKYCGSHDCFAKGVDIWRCDITKRTFFNFVVTVVSRCDFSTIVCLIRELNLPLQFLLMFFQVKNKKRKFGRSRCEKVKQLDHQQSIELKILLLLFKNKPTEIAVPAH